MSNIVLSVFSVLFYFFSFALFAQGVFEVGTHVDSGKTLNYRIMYPDDFDESRKYPVVLFLHGAGERGSDNKIQLVHGSKLFMDQDNMKKNPSIVIFPQCPKEDFWAKTAFSNENRERKFEFKPTGEPNESMKLVLSMMDSISNLKYSDNERFYVGGLSMGGMGTFEILTRRPSMFAAAFPICGGGNPSSVSEYAKKVSLWVFHGAKDDVVFPSYSTDMVIALQASGSNVKYTLYKDANHNSWDAAFGEPNLFPWLFNQKKFSK